MTDYPGTHVCSYLAVELHQLIGKELTTANRTFDLKSQYARSSSGSRTAGGHGGCHAGLRPGSGSEGGFVLVPWFLG